MKGKRRLTWASIKRFFTGPEAIIFCFFCGFSFIVINFMTIELLNYLVEEDKDGKKSVDFPFCMLYVDLFRGIHINCMHVNINWAQLNFN